MTRGKAFLYARISDQPAKLLEPAKRPVAIRLDPWLLDACVGHYEQAPCAAFPAGIKAAIWREGDQLIWRSSGRNAPKGLVEIYPESETNFFDKFDGTMAFIKNDKGEVTTVIFQHEEQPEIVGRKLTN
jgi:hypothetical protein